MSIEQKIAELLEESKKQGLSEEAVAEETTEKVVEDQEALAEQNNEETSEESTEEVVAEGEMPPALKKALDKKKGDDDEDDDEDEDEDEDDDKKEDKMKKEELSFDVKEDVAALTEGEELSEEFKQKAETIFEAAVVARVKAETARIEEEFETRLNEQVEKNVEGLVDQVDGYLGYVAVQWIEQNELALERGMKSEILEGFVEGLKGLFEQHYIDVPEERFDVLGQMEEKVEELEDKLNEQVKKNIEAQKVISEHQRKEILDNAKEGLTDTEVEKLMGLAEELAFDDAETFAKKVQTIRESYFTNKAKSDTIVESVITDEPVEELTEEVKKHVDPKMAAYMSALYNK